MVPLMGVALRVMIYLMLVWILMVLLMIDLLCLLLSPFALLLFTGIVLFG